MVLINNNNKKNLKEQGLNLEHSTTYNMGLTGYLS